MNHKQLAKVITELDVVLGTNQISTYEAISVLLSLAADASERIYKDAPNEYFIIQAIWDDVRKLLPIVPNERNKAAGIA